jgi:TPR repeat protein
VGTPKNATYALQAYETAGWLDDKDYPILSDVYLRLARMEKDEEKARQLRAKAVEAAKKAGFEGGHAVADWRAAASAVSKPHPDKLIKNLQWAADLENPEAQFAYAKILLDGSNELVKTGLFAEDEAGSDLLKSLGIRRNSTRAIQYLEAASSKGNSEAAVVLGGMYRTGSHTRRNREKALNYFLLAAENGTAEAALEAGKLMQNGVGNSEITPWTQRRLFELAASQNNAEAEFQLALLHATGAAGTVDPKLAAGHYLRAAELGHESARKLVLKAFIDPLSTADRATTDPAASSANILKRLRDMTKDEDVFKYAEEVAANGDALGQLALAECYKNGIGTTEDPSQVVELLKQATGLEVEKLHTEQN